MKFLLPNEDPCNPNCGWFHDIQGEFWLHCWVLEPLPSCENPAILDKKKVTKKFNKKCLYFSHTYNTLQELLGISKKRPFAFYSLNCLKKLLLEKKIKIIMPAVGSWLIAMVYDVGLHVDFSSMNFFLGLHPPSVKWTWMVSAFSTNESSYIVMVMGLQPCVWSGP